MQNTKLHSTTGLIVKNLHSFVIFALNKATNIPIKSEKNPNFKKLPIILRGVQAVKLAPGPENWITALNKIILIASFVTPSPNTRLNNLGYFSELISDTAATTSLEHNSELINKISKIVSLNSSYYPVAP